MRNSPDDRHLPAEVDFSQGVRGLHHIPEGSRAFLPVSIEKSVRDYFANKAEERGVPLSDLLTEVLKREMNARR